jgi:5-methylcytosine-specific restriction endonuclease McrA
MHNIIFKEVTILESILIHTGSKNYVNIFLSEFKNLDEKDEKLVTQTIICASKILLDEIVEKCSNPKAISTELIKCKKLTRISYYKNLQERINKLNKKTSRTAEEGKDLKKLKKEFNGELRLRPLIQKIFNYSGRQKSLLKFYANTDCRVCAYCLAQYTSIYRSSSSGTFYLTGNLDHVKAKSKFPYLSLSINNLVPVCAHCNQRKLDRVFNYDPFNSKHKHNFDFSNCIDVVKSKVVLKSLDDLQISPAKGQFKDLATKLDFKELYQNFSSCAETIVDRYQKFYSEGYYNHLEKITNRPNSREFIEFFISEVPLTNDNVLKHPLTKFKMDLLNTIKSKRLKT